MKTNDKTILLVDDDSNFLFLAQKALQKDGYRIIPKKSSYEALSVIDGGADIDLIMVDYQMSGMDGLKFLTAIRKRRSRVPIVMLSDNGCD